MTARVTPFPSQISDWMCPLARTPGDSVPPPHPNCRAAPYRINLESLAGAVCQGLPRPSGKCEQTRGR